MTAIQIAQIIINKLYDNNITDINITKLQKLLYVVYGIYLSKNKNTLFQELPLCLPYGPVFESVLQKYNTGEFNLQQNNLNSEKKLFTDELDQTINYVVQSIGNWSAKELSTWSHRKGSAWDMVEKTHSYWGEIIPSDLIKNEFDSLVGNSNNE